MRFLTFDSIVLTLAPAALIAQSSDRCAVAPGARLGVQSFQCTNCEIKVESGRTLYTFHSEPVLTATEDGSGLESGDIIEAIDAMPITTRAGAERFAYPENGRHTVTLRRGRNREETKVPVTSFCRGTVSSSSSSSASSSGSGSSSSGESGSGSGSGSHSASMSDDGVHTGKGYGTGRGVGVPVTGGDQLVVVDGVVMNGGSNVQTGRYGFAVDCRDACASSRMRDGSYAYRYERYPVVAIVRAGSVAERAGLRVGDEIRTINGRSILADDALNGTDTGNMLRVTVRRDGADVSMTMTLPR